MRLQRWLMTAVAALLAAAALAADLLVIDGDTVRMGEERIRIIGIDTAELRCKCPTECRLAAAAKERLDELLASGYVTVDRKGRDKYQRTLAVIRVGGQDVGEALVREGLARRYDGRTRRAGWC